MNQAGWYPDPSGAPGQFRYWDGSAWSAETTSSPGAAPNPGTPRSGRRSGVVVAALVLVALLVVAAVWRTSSGGGIAGGRGQDTNTASPTVSAWDETSSASPTPSAEPTSTSAPPSDDATASEPASPTTQSGAPGAETSVPCPDTDSEDGQVVAGRMTSGRISAPLIPSWGETHSFYLSGMSNAISQRKLIAPRWESSIAVGSAARSDFASPKVAAEGLTLCLASSWYYTGFTGLKTLSNEAVTVDGHAAHRIQTEVYVNNQGPNIAGDVVIVVVVDTGDPATLGVFVSSVTIGDSATQAQVDPVLSDLRIS